MAKKFNKIKVLKAITRQDKISGKGGVHMTNKDRPRQKLNLDEFVEDHITIEYADIITAFNKQTIGTKVTNKNNFHNLLSCAIFEHDFNKERIPGQAVIELPKVACNYVSAGIGKRTQDPNNYVLRLYRGSVRTYLKRNYACPCMSVRVVVYTIDAYLKDPDITLEEAERAFGCTHVLVAVLGSEFKKSPLSPGAFVHNLAGGNHEAMNWTADEIREKAKEIESHYNEWCIVAD